jgi:hypothetical protein
MALSATRRPFLRKRDLSFGKSRDLPNQKMKAAALYRAAE